MMFSSFFRGPRWIDLELILAVVADESNVTLTILNIKKLWLYKEVQFEVTGKEEDIKSFINDLERYGLG